MQDAIRKLADRRIYLGTSSWKYEGWKGILYAHEYPTDKAFKEGCLEEYARAYPCVGVDHTYYAWPTPAAFGRYVAQTPPEFRFGLKVTDRITVFQFPRQRRYGKDAGARNSSFLDPGAFTEHFLAPIAPFLGQIGPVILEFSHFHPGTLTSGRDFLERLDAFFTALGRERLPQLAVEIRNDGWLKPPYFELLRQHGVAHVFNSWTRMPTISRQLELSTQYPQPCYVARILLQPGTPYEDAVEAFSPYDRIRMEYPELRAGAAALISRALAEKTPAYVFVNNRAEGCAPKTIAGIVEKLPP